MSSPATADCNSRPLARQGAHRSLASAPSSFRAREPRRQGSLADDRRSARPPHAFLGVLVPYQRFDAGADTPALPAQPATGCALRSPCVWGPKGSMAFEAHVSFFATRPACPACEWGGGDLSARQTSDRALPLALSDRPHLVLVSATSRLPAVGRTVHMSAFKPLFETFAHQFSPPKTLVQ